MCPWCALATQTLLCPPPTGDHPFECEFCGSCFRDEASLRGHKRTHTGEKPYECNGCGKKFSLKHQLETHYRVHTGKRSEKSQSVLGMSPKPSALTSVGCHLGAGIAGYLSGAAWMKCFGLKWAGIFCSVNLPVRFLWAQSAGQDYQHQHSVRLGWLDLAASYLHVACTAFMAPVSYLNSSWAFYLWKVQGSLVLPNPRSLQSLVMVRFTVRVAVIALYQTWLVLLAALQTWVCERAGDEAWWEDVRLEVNTLGMAFMLCPPSAHMICRMWLSAST